MINISRIIVVAVAFLATLLTYQSNAQTLLWQIKVPKTLPNFDNNPSAERFALWNGNSLVVYNGITGDSIISLITKQNITELRLHSNNKKLYIRSDEYPPTYYSWDMMDTITKIDNGRGLVSSAPCFGSYRGRATFGITSDRELTYSSNLYYAPINQVSARCFTVSSLWGGSGSSSKYECEPYFVSNDGKTIYGYYYSQVQYFNMGGSLREPVIYTAIWSPSFIAYTDNIKPVEMYDATRYLQTNNGIFDIKENRTVKSIPYGTMIKQRFVLSFINGKIVLYDMTDGKYITILENAIDKSPISQYGYALKSKELFIRYADTLEKYSLASVIDALPTMLYTVSPVVPDTVKAGDTLSYYAGSFPETNSRYRWNFGDSTPLDTTERGLHMYRKAGVYTITLSAESIPMNQKTQVRRTIVVLPMDSLRANITLSTPTVNADFPVVFHANAQPKKYLEYSWDFGDGTTSKDSVVEHTYLSSGIMTVKLRVLRTLDNAIAEQTLSIKVSAGLENKVWSSFFDTSSIQSLSFSPDGSKILITPKNSPMQIYSVSGGKPLSTLRVEKDPSVSNMLAYFKPNSDNIYYCGYAMKHNGYKVMDILTGEFPTDSQIIVPNRNEYCPNSNIYITDKYVGCSMVYETKLYQINVGYDKNSINGIFSFSSDVDTKWSCKDYSKDYSYDTYIRYRVGKGAVIGSYALKWRSGCQEIPNRPHYPSFPYSFCNDVCELSKERYAWNLCSKDTSSFPYTVLITDDYGKEIKRFIDSTYSLCAISGGTQLVTRSGIWDVEQGVLVKPLSLPPSVHYEVTSNGRYLLAQSAKTIQIFDLSTGNKIYETDSMTVPITSSTISNNGDYLAIGASNGFVAVLNIRQHLANSNEHIPDDEITGSNVIPVIHPNPTTGNASITFPSPYTGIVSIHDMLGVELYRTMVNNSYTVNLPCTEYNVGVYVIGAGAYRGVIAVSK